MPQTQQSQPNSKSEEKSMTYFFQEKNGDIYFLHPINYNILITEYEGEENIPTEVSGKILEIEAYQMSPTFRNQYNTLNHLRDGNFFYLVEIDMKPLVSNLALKQFHNILKDRSKSRNLIKEEEAHYENLVQKIRDKEKEKIKITADKKFSYDSLDMSLSLGGKSENYNSNPQPISEKKENKLKTLFSKKK